MFAFLQPGNVTGGKVDLKRLLKRSKLASGGAAKRVKAMVTSNI
jgi:hypothetical protein